MKKQLGHQDAFTSSVEIMNLSSSSQLAMNPKPGVSSSVNWSERELNNLWGSTAKVMKAVSKGVGVRQEAAR